MVSLCCAVHLSIYRLAQIEELCISFHLVKLQLEMIAAKPGMFADCPTIPDDRHTLRTQQKHRKAALSLSGCALREFKKVEICWCFVDMGSRLMGA